jgi:hypothetical protein
MATGAFPGTVGPARSAEPPAPGVNASIGDPIPIALGLFGFALLVYGARFVDVSPATIAAGSQSEGLNYALLAGAVAEALGGIIAVIRGQLYPGYVTTTFGLWLFGLFFLVTAGAGAKDFTPDALGWYALCLVIPVAIMAVPSIVHRNYPFIVAFLGLEALLILFGIGFHAVYTAVAAATATSPPDLSTQVNLIEASAWCAFVAAAALWWVFAKDVYEATGVLSRKAG